MKRKLDIVLNAKKPDTMVDRIKDLYNEVTDDTFNITAVPLEEHGTRSSNADEYLYSGGTRLSVGGDANEQLRGQLYRQVRAIEVPQLGICFGAQVLARAHGAQIKQMTERRSGLVEVSLTDEGKRALGGFATISAEGQHTWVLDEDQMPQGFTVDAISVDGIEAFHHDNQSLGGVQFHPESKTPGNGGAAIFGALREKVITGATIPTRTAK